jgi:hypothetical protein
LVGLDECTKNYAILAGNKRRKFGGKVSIETRATIFRGMSLSFYTAQIVSELIFFFQISLPHLPNLAFFSLANPIAQFYYFG